MPAFLSTSPPATLRQWLRQTLIWTALCFGLDVAVWLVCNPASIGRGEAGGGARMFLLLLANVGITVVLARQMTFFEPLYQQVTKTSTWQLKLTSTIWWLMLLVLTGIWVTADVGLLLAWLLTASDDGRPWYSVLTANSVALA